MAVQVDRYASSPLASVLVIGAAAAWIIVSIAARCIGGSVKLPSMTIPRVVRATQQGRVRLSAARPPY